MATSVLSQYEIDVDDVEYLRHGNRPLLARLYRPRGKGPFPLIIDLHGGGWNRKDRMTDVGTAEPLAKSGAVVASLDFRMPPEAKYPASMQDVNYAIRWFKTRDMELGSHPDMVGILGVSSGGHQAILTAMRPNDARYAALPLSSKATVDATVRCVVLCWPVVDPLGRYRYAKEMKAAGRFADKTDDWLSNHDAYWQDEAAMAEGNPALALERGESILVPPVLYIQGTSDKSHPEQDRERFIAGYRKAGGRVDLHLFDGMDHAFITEDPHSQAAVSAIEKIIAFVQREFP